MDEPYNSNTNRPRRDYATNAPSVQGHSAFCSAINGARLKPTIVDIVDGLTSGADHSGAWTNYSNLSNNINILCVNDYGSSAPQAWQTVNAAAWAYSAIDGSSDKMVMPFIQGVDAYSSTLYYYQFYGCLIHGARGILWWMENPDGSVIDLSDYSALKDIYSGFTSQREFGAYTSQYSDRDMFLEGDDTLSSSLTCGTNFTGAADKSTAYMHYPAS